MTLGLSERSPDVAYWRIGLARRRFESFDRAVDLRYMAGLDDEPTYGYNSSHEIVAEVPGIPVATGDSPVGPFDGRGTMCLHTKRARDVGAPGLMAPKE